MVNLQEELYAVAAESKFITIKETIGFRQQT